MLILSLVVFSLMESYCVTEAFPFQLRNRENNVFNNVSMWALHSRGAEYLGKFGNYLICEDSASVATFAHIRKCFDNCSDVSSFDLAYFIGVYGSGSKQFSLNLKERQCQSKTKARKHRSLSHNLQIIRHISRKEYNSFREIETVEHPGYRWKRTLSNKKWSHLAIKLLIVIDYTLYSSLNQDFEYIAQYLNIFWSNVDLKYRKISRPKINIEVIGVIVAGEANVLDYVDNYQFIFLEKNTLDVYESLESFLKIKKHIRNLNLPNYHAIITLSGLQGFSDEDIIYGMAYKKGLCSHHRNGAIIIDDGQYLGIHNAVHELGHLLGLDHDGVDEIIDDEFNYYNCTNPIDESSKSYIMYEKNKFSQNEVSWSNCSLRYFSILESDEAISCAGISSRR